MWKTAVFISACLLKALLCDPIAADALPAFPGAQGFGSRTVGGRGGRVIEVTNLNDSGAGSFRQAAVVETGPRIIVFRIGGIINLRSDVEIVNPFVTIAGQTAPRAGIVLRGGRLGVRTHDVIIRGMKVRPGDASGGSVSSRDGIAITVDPVTKAEVYNVIVDHNSISWGVDENASIWDNTHGMEGVKLHDVTYSWNIISDSLRCGILNEAGEGPNCSASGNAPYDRRVRGFGMLIGEDTKKVTVHHNLIANNDFRNPAITQGATLEFVNNVIYNYGLGSMSITSGGTSIGPNTPVLANIIGNYFKSSAGSHKKNFEGRINATIKGIEVTCSLPPQSRIHAKGNIDTLYRPNDSQNEWNAVYFYEGCGRTIINSKSDVSVLPATSGLNPTDANTAYSEVLQSAGARAQGLDSVDTRAISTTTQGTSPVSTQIIQAPGSRNQWFIDTPLEAGPLPSYPTTQSSIADGDHDGMPDDWEASRGGDLNPSIIAPSGYTWVEEYINSLIPQTGSSQPPLTGGSMTVGALMDAYVDSAYPTTNFNSAMLKSKGPFQQIAYLKFDLSSVTAVQRAVLRIYVSNPSAHSHMLKETSDAWGEATITYRTLKTPGATLATFTPNASGWKEIDITGYIQAKKGLSRASIAIQTTSSDDMSCYSSESSYSPELVVSY